MIGNISYETALRFAQTWGAVYFALMFIAAFVYAYWPGNRDTFQKAATSLLKEDEAP
jgi:cytochrome c oxidase cbb3-type subunit 4